MILECFQIAKTAVFINECILVVIPAILFGILCCSANETRSRNILDVDLDALPRILHLFVRFWRVFWIWELYHTLSTSPQNPI